VYILSLPSFTWIKAFPENDNSTTPAEVGHGGCSANVINRKQMLVIGGWFPLYDKCDAPSGQGQHNMVLGYNGDDAKLWDKFQPNISAYVVPSPIISAIGGGYVHFKTPSSKVVSNSDNRPTGGATKTAPAAWGHPDLATYYTLKPTFAARSATRLLPSPTGSSPSSGSNKSNVAVIAGSVVGGLVGLIIILCLILFCLRRHKNALKKKQEKEGDANNAPPPLPPAELATTIPYEMPASEATKYVSTHNRADTVAMAQYQEHPQQYSHSASHDYSSSHSTPGPPSYATAAPYTSPTEPSFNPVSPRGQSFSEDGIAYGSQSTNWGASADYPSPGPSHEAQYSYPSPTTPRHPSNGSIQQQVPIYYPHNNTMPTRSPQSPGIFPDDGGMSEGQLRQNMSVSSTPAQFYSHSVQHASTERSSDRRGPDERRPVQGRFMEEEHV
jgi:hypothetical protein